MDGIKVIDVRVLPGDSAFLIDDGTTSILVDSGFGFTGQGVAENIQKVLGSRSLDFIFLTHSHYDHVLGVPFVTREYPHACVVAGSYATRIFDRPGAKATMRDLDRTFADTCGVGEYEDLVDHLRVDMAVEDGDVIKAGAMEFLTINLPGHTKCSVGFYLPEKKFLVATESLGVYFGEDVYMPAYLVGYQMTLDSFQRIKELDVDYILSPHYGLLDQAESKRFLQESEAVSRNTAMGIKKILEAGGTDEDAIEYVRKIRYANPGTHKTQPEAAFNLNTSIMVKLIRKELLEK